MKIVAFQLHVCVVVFIYEKENWQCFSRLLSRHFKPCFEHNDFSLGHVTKNQPMAVSVQLSESLGIIITRDLTKAIKYLHDQQMAEAVDREQSDRHVTVTISLGSMVFLC